MRSSATTLEPEISDAELAAMLRALHVAPLRGSHLEIGTAAGGTLRALMLAYPAERRPHFVVVDPMTYFPEQHSIVRRNLASAGIDPDSVEIRISKSWPALQKALQNGERYSFIFIDASHKAHRVMQDICWARLLEPGGLLCFHDYAPRFPGVMFAVGRLLSADENYEIVEQTESMLILRKTAAGKPEVRRRDLIAAQFVNLGHQIAAGVRRRIGRTRFRNMAAQHSQSISTIKGDYVFTPANLYYGRKLIDREVCKNNLLDFKDVLDRAGVEFGLIYGTLLGAVREGNFIEHDEDVDVYIKDSELDKLLALLFELRACGFEVARYNQRQGLLSFIRDNDYIDVYVFWRTESGRWRRTSDASLPASSLDSHDLINFLGVEFKTLKDHRSFLDRIYGTDWVIPKKNFHARF